MSVDATNLVKSFGERADVAAVGGVSFSAPEGKVTALLGPSGSGKSTLLRLIAGLEEPDSGSIRIAGADVTRVPVKRRDVGFVFQSYALFRHMTVRDNIAFGRKSATRRRRAADARVRELLSLIQLEGYETATRPNCRRATPAHRPGARLGHGTEGAAARRAVRCSRRASARRAARVALALHEKTRVTTLLVTHDQEEALELSQHVVLLNGGLVAQAGAPHELYDNPASPFVAAFLGGANVMRSRAKMVVR